MELDFQELHEVIEAKERQQATLRNTLSIKSTTSEIEKIRIKDEIINLNSELELLRKQLTRLLVIQNLEIIEEKKGESVNSVLNFPTKRINNKDKIDELRKELENGNIIEAIEVLKDLTTKEEDKNNITLIKGQFAIINKKFYEGIISYDQLKVETNRIMMFIISNSPKLE